MGYTAPRLSELMTSVIKITDQYTNDNPARKQLIHLLELVHEFISDIYQADDNLSEKDLQEICLGAWVFCYENIASNYHLISPEPTWRFFGSTGSTLFKLISDELHIQH